MFYKIKTVTPLEGFKFLVHFCNGDVKQYDMDVAANKNDVFAELKENRALFHSATVDAGGYGISWNDEIDIDCNELWEHGTYVETAFSNLLSFADATELWQLNESTLRKAISYGKLVEGIDVQKFGKQWIVTRSAMEREYGRRT